MPVAITVKYKSAGFNTPARYTATTPNGQRLVMSASQFGDKGFDEAAIAFCKKFNWTDRDLYVGGLDKQNGHVYVFAGEYDRVKPNGTPNETATEKALITALQSAWEMLENSKIKFKICDGGPGNLGDTAKYQAALKQAQDAIKPFGRL